MSLLRPTNAPEAVKMPGPFTGGFGYSGERWSVDLAYEYSHQPVRTISQGAVVDGSYRLDTHALSLSCGVKF